VAELCADLLGSDAVDAAKDMTAHQDDLGDICDARANVRLIDEFLERDLSASVRQELLLLRARNEGYLNDVLDANGNRR
jgi:CHAD domain-containing protein